MITECKIEKSRLILVFDDVKAFYIKGVLTSNGQQFVVKKEDYWDRNDMSPEEKEEGIQAVERYNSTHTPYVLVDD